MPDLTQGSRHTPIRYTLSQMTRYWTAQNTTFGDR